MKFPRLSLRTKLAGVSLLLFVIPLIGFWYASNMQSFLMEAQEQALSLTARSVATIFNDRPELFKINFLQSVDESKEIHAYSLPKPINLDGFSEDWGGLKNEMVFYGHENILEGSGIYNPASLSFKHITGRYENNIYAFFHVRDDAVVYRDSDSLHVDRSDHLQIGIENPDGRLSLYLISPTRSGWVTAHLMDENTRNFIPVKNETRIHGFWSDTFDGYNVEIRLKTELIKNKISFAVADVDDTESGQIEMVIGTASTKRMADMGVLLSRSPEIEKILNKLKPPATKIWVVDRGKRVRADVGSLKGDNYQFTQENRLGGQFLNKILQPVYAMIRIKTPPDLHEDYQYLSRYDLADIDRALIGKPFTTRMLIDGTGSEIILAAEPLWVEGEVQGVVMVEQTTDNILTEKRKIIEDTISITLLVFFVGAFCVEVDISVLSEACVSFRGELGTFCPFV